MIRVFLKTKKGRLAGARNIKGAPFLVALLARETDRGQHLFVKTLRPPPVFHS